MINLISLSGFVFLIFTFSILEFLWFLDDLLLFASLGFYDLLDLVLYLVDLLKQSLPSPIYSCSAHEPSVPIGTDSMGFTLDAVKF